jgi:hypothetical protein
MKNDARQVRAVEDGRVETGAVQFEDDWPGIFIRGEDAMVYYIHLGLALQGKGNTTTEVVVRNLQKLILDVMDRPT